MANVPRSTPSCLHVVYEQTLRSFIFRRFSRQLSYFAGRLHLKNQVAHFGCCSVTLLLTFT